MCAYFRMHYCCNHLAVPSLSLTCRAVLSGHPDNVAPAIYGGLQIGVKFTNSECIPKWTTSQVAIPTGLQCVLFLPNMTTETVTARSILPKSVSRDDAIFNLSRVALLVNALSTCALHNLKIAMDDRLHQPQRADTEQGGHINALIKAAIDAGAHSACLSGSGPAILALTSGAKGTVNNCHWSHRPNYQLSRLTISCFYRGHLHSTTR